LAYVVWAQVKYMWVADGAGPSMMGQQQSEVPGFGGVAATPGSVPSSFNASDVDAQLVPGGDSPTGANFQTALNALATDLYNRLTTVGAVPGFAPSATLLSVLQGWSTGGGIC
jgi:hypothetical protein